MVDAQIFNLIYSTSGLSKSLEKIGLDSRFEVYKTDYKGRKIYIQVSQNDELVIFFRDIQNEEDRFKLVTEEIFLHVTKKENKLEYILEIPSTKNRKVAGKDFEKALDASFNVIDILKRKGHLRNY